MSQIKTIHNPIGSLERFLDLLLISLIVYMTLKGGTSGACAACKYQRRRCAADCPLAPYFPAEQPKLFQNVHRLFGVRSIVKILENLDEVQRPEAMKSIIFQSYVRDRNPVHGCLGITQQLQYMIWVAEEELKAVNAQLQLYRNGQNHPNPHNMMIHEIGDKQEDLTTSQLDLGMGLPVNTNQGNNTIPFFSPVSETQQSLQPHMSYGSDEVNNHEYNHTQDSCKEVLNNHNASLAWGQNHFPYNNNNHHNYGFDINQNEHCSETKNNNSVMAIQSQLVNLQMASNQHEEEVDVHTYDEIHQFLEIIDESQSFTETKEVYASSSGESLKEPMDEIGEKELRRAATCFSLTSVN
ncbi:LOB domain-containing protein 27 [Hirschfeldia incana]|nr:LOB domain-containing protein 27 [Hirschfeldia incana]